MLTRKTYQSPRVGFHFVDECLEGSRHLTPAGIVEKKTDRAWPPVFKQRDKPFPGYVFFNKSGGDAGYSHAVESGADRQIAMTRDQRARHGDLQAFPSFLEIPSVHYSTGVAVADTIVVAKISGDLWCWTLCQIVRRGNDRGSRIFTDPHRNHVLLNAMTRPNTCIVAFPHDVGERAVVAYDYMQRHGQARWARIRASQARNPSCPKLGGYWRFYDCQYRKGTMTCAKPRHIAACPLPRQPLRNGHLNQMAYSLVLFMRDVADGDLVAWIDAQLGSVNSQSAMNWLASLREAIIGPLRNVYGVADKVLAMALADLLLSAGQQRPLWREVGVSLVAVDTLVHNFLHRTGILRRLGAQHPYGERCYRAGGCADILALLAANIDARQFNPTFPKTFPRFVQNAVWRYCAANGLAVCNGNQIANDRRCGNGHCQLFRRCDRVALHERKKVAVNQ